MLLGVETKRKEREDLEANFSLRSESSESDDRRKKSLPPFLLLDQNDPVIRVWIQEE